MLNIYFCFYKVDFMINFVISTCVICVKFIVIFCLSELSVNHHCRNETKMGWGIFFSKKIAHASNISLNKTSSIQAFVMLHQTEVAFFQFRTYFFQNIIHFCIVTKLTLHAIGISDTFFFLFLSVRIKRVSNCGKNL